MLLDLIFRLLGNVLEFMIGLLPNLFDPTGLESSLGAVEASAQDVGAVLGENGTQWVPWAFALQVIVFYWSVWTVIVVFGLTIRLLRWSRVLG